jgi:guanylate kinase
MTEQLLPPDASVLVIIGPSGVGKSAIVRELVDIDLIDLTPTWTDRPPRSEENELEHAFVTSERFDQLVEEDFFSHPPLTFFNLPYRYAVPKLRMPRPDQTPAVMARISARPLIDKLYPNRIFYQIEAPYKLVASRLEERAQTGDQLGSRLTDYDIEISQGREVARRTFMNDGPLSSVLRQIIDAISEDF